MFIKKFGGLFILIIAFGVSIWGFISIYDSIPVTDSNILSNLFSAGLGVFAALIGGSISGLGSYFGGVAGALENYELLKKQTEETNIEKLYFLLRFIFDGIKLPENTCTVEELSRKSVIDLIIIPDKLVYDEDWRQYVPCIAKLNREDIKSVIEWLSLMEKIDEEKEEAIVGINIPSKKGYYYHANEKSFRDKWSAINKIIENL